MEKPAPKRGIARILSAFDYSLQGIKACFKSEEAFRQESLIFLLLLPLLILLPLGVIFKLFLLAVNMLVLIVELLNSAIESVVDKMSPEFDPLAKRAKDMGSAAVLLALVLAGTAWLSAIFYAL